jgi:hypothetical protein
VTPSMPGSTLRLVIKRGMRSIDVPERRLVRLDEKAMLVAARRCTGSNEFGDDAFGNRAADLQAD